MRSGWHSLLACCLVGSQHDRQAPCLTALIGPLPPLQLCGRSRWAAVAQGRPPDAEITLINNIAVVITSCFWPCPLPCLWPVMISLLPVIGACIIKLLPSSELSPICANFKSTSIFSFICILFYRHSIYLPLYHTWFSAPEGDWSLWWGFNVRAICLFPIRQSWPSLSLLFTVYIRAL